MTAQIKKVEPTFENNSYWDLKEFKGKEIKSYMRSINKSEEWIEFLIGSIKEAEPRYIVLNISSKGRRMVNYLNRLEKEYNVKNSFDNKFVYKFIEDIADAVSEGFYERK